jgi:glycosyltransferase involved in cell wall biosynthesis
MKIGYDAKRLYCNFTGLGNYSRTLLRNLDEFYPDHMYFLYTTDIVKTDETIGFVEDPAFLTVMPEPRSKSYWRSFGIKDRLLTDKIKLYHGLSNEIPFGIRKTGIKSVVTIHDLIFKVLPKNYSAIDRRIYDIKSKYACAHADRIVAISHNTKEDIIRFYGTDPDRIDVVYQACNPVFYKLRPKHDTDLVLRHYNLPSTYLLAVGSVEPRKNLKKTIEALAWLRRDLQIPLVIVGKGGKYRKEVRAFARQSGIERYLFWLDRLESADHLQSIYQGAQALIYPSFYEGFGLPVVEALLSRTPVITGDNSSMHEAGGPMSVYVNPKEAEAIAQGIEKILTDEIYRFNMAETGYQYAHQNFSPGKVTREMMDCYLRVAGD